MLFFFDKYIRGYCLKVTSVGINTEWGLLMASISEDTGEETPLQVGFFHNMVISGFVQIWLFFKWFSLLFTIYGNCLQIMTGAVEWGCNVYRFRGTHGSCICSNCPDG